jgi:putative tail protein
VLYWCCGATTISRNLYTIDLDPLSHGGTPALGSPRTLPHDLRGGMCYVKSTDRIYIRDYEPTVPDLWGLDPVTLAVEDTIDDVTLTKPGLYPIDGKRFIVAGDYHKVPIRPLHPNSGEPLSQIVQDLCRDVGLLLGDLNTLGLSDIVHGYVRAQPMQATAALQPLMLTYQFDGVESDYLLAFPKRDGSSVGTIPEDDLGAREIGQDPGPPLAISRMQETDLPTALSIHYSEPRLSYQQGSQIHRRVYTPSQQTMQIDLPIAMNSTLARRLTRRLMNRSWVERTRYRFAVGPEYLWLDPGDIVKVLADNATHLVRLDKVEFGAPGLVLAEGVAQRITLLPYLDEVAADLDAAPIYEEGEELPPPDEIPPAELAPVPNTRLVLLDLPILADQHNDPAFYYAGCGYAAGGWHGAVLYKSTDNGATYGALDAMITAAAIGSATTALPSGPTTIWDNGSTVNVNLTQGTLASDTEANVLNMAALGVHGRWEVLQWQTATLEADGSYTLSNLLRGRKGTEHAVAAHQIGDTFVALSVSSVNRAVMQSGELGLARTYKGVSIGASFAEASSQAFTNTGVGLECYSPVHIKGTRVASGDLTITAIRRTRAQGEWRDLVDVPLFEDAELYDLEVLNGLTVVRTWTGLTAASQVYTSSQQVTDFGSNQAAVNVKWYQRSTLAGRGYPGTATV